MTRAKGSILGSRSSRLGLEAGKRHHDQLTEGLTLAYRRPLPKLKGEQVSGTWAARWYDKATKAEKQERLGNADDFLDADGIKILTYKQAQDMAEAWFKAIIQRVQHELTGEVAHEGPYTVAAAWADYVDDAKRRGVKGVAIYETVAKAKILPALGAIEVDKLTRKRIEDWHLGVADSPRHTGKKAKELEPGEEPEAQKVPSEDEKRARRDTANRDLSILKAALNFALQRGGRVHGSAPWRIVKPFAGTASSRVRILTKDEQDRLIAACDEDFRTLVVAALYSGARYGELSKVQVQDFNGKTLLIKWGKSKGAAKPRHCFLTDEAIAWFTELVKGRGPSERMFQRKDAVRTTREELKDFDGWAAYDQVHALAKACKAAGIEAINFHQLRHTHASNLLSSGTPGAYVSKQLGQADGRMLARHYGHLTDADMAAAIQKNGPSLTLPALVPIGSKLMDDESDPPGPKAARMIQAKAKKGRGAGTKT